MLEPLRAWLNGTKDYNAGITLYEKLGSNTALKNLFRKGATEFTRRRLQEELLFICDDLKTKNYGTKNIIADACINVDGSHNKGNSANYIKACNSEAPEIQQKEFTASNTKSSFYDNPGTPPENNSHSAVPDSVPDESHTGSKLLQGHKDHNVSNEIVLEQKNEKQPANGELYYATKLQADKLYKETMNNRAVLFALATPHDFTDPNTEAKINSRAQLALSVVTGFQQASVHFDKAEYVKEHGRLPDQDDNQEENDYDLLPDLMVKQTLDNLRKNVNKMKKREQTPERVALQQKHEANIEKLLKRWHSLQLIK